MKRSFVCRLLCVALCVVLTLGSVAFAEEDSYTRLTYGSRDKEETNGPIYRMQARLKALGYMSVSTPPTNYYGDKTLFAVEEFQAAVGMSLNGAVATAEFQEKLFSSSAPMKGQSSGTSTSPSTTGGSSSGGTSTGTTPAPDPSYYFDLKQGDHSSAVKQMQKRLIALGYLADGGADMDYGANTATAVAAFQKAAGLPVNGALASAQMQAILFSYSAPRAGSTGSTGSPSTTTPAPAVTTPGPTPTPDASVYTDLKLNDVSSAVKKMQKRLIDLGYLNDRADMCYGANTAAAVAAFQQAAGLPVNPNLASAQMQAILFSYSAPSKITTPAPGSDATPVPSYTEVKYGDKGSSVKKLQQRLRELGYLQDRVDGDYGPNTGAALALFQAAVHQPVNTQLASSTVLAALYASDAPKYGSTAAPSATPTPTGTGTAPAETPTPSPTPTPAIVTPSIISELKYGTNGSTSVRLMQDRLKQLGYFSGDSTGNYYAVTRDAVAAFQAAAGLTVDGRVASTDMQRLLYSTSAPAKGSSPIIVAPSVYTELKYGMTNNSAITLMQTRLKALGYFSDNCTGNYYNATAKAVAAFQTAVGMTVNGNVASVAMQQALYADTAPTAGSTTPSTPTNTSEPTSDNYPDLTYGTTSSQAVFNAQKRLAELGFMNASDTKADYNSTMVSAVTSFQNYFGYAINGKVLTGAQQELLFTSGTRADLYRIRQSGTSTTPGATKTPKSDTDYSGVNLSATLKKGSTGEQVRLLTSRLIELGYFTGSPVTTFDDAVYNAVRWFQNSNSLSADGIAGKNTLAKLYTQACLTASGASVGKEDQVIQEVDGTSSKPTISSISTIAWGNDTYFNRRTGIFKDGAYATVTDVATGISYRVRRRGGYNHADVEPVTAYDTWQMYRIYNQTWSWNRRAVVVTFANGVSSAASINGMPHGLSDITDNGMDGHTCIHFSGSHTHENNNLDPAHQAAVAAAASTNVSELQQKINSQS